MKLPSGSNGERSWALRMWRCWALTACALVLPAAMAPAVAQTDIARTVHNLTPSGPGTYKETRPVGVCVFCHTPHNANPKKALWNRDLPAITYQLYESSTLKATLNQPTGSSRLCLSCHDGILAMGNLKVPPRGEQLKLGAMLGKNVLGTDLSDDHPISFVYDSTLAINRAGLVDPANLPKTLRLDAGKQMQCTTCHDAHEHRRAKFLRMDNQNGGLCLACHRPAQWTGSAHANSHASWSGSGTNPWPEDAGATVAANACRNCHRTHSAGHGQRLMAWAAEPDNCLVCHNTKVAQKNIAAEFTGGVKYSRHPIDSAQWTHDPLENAIGMARHVTCADCHNAHAANATPALAPMVSGRLLGVRGVTVNGSPVAESSFEYQICGKCHGFNEPTTIGVTRMDGTRIVSSKIDPANQSYHPIASTGRNTTVRGLLLGYTPSSIMTCTDCHNNNDWTQAGMAPRGPHASRFAPILERNYLLDDPTPESYTNYDLCYKCHDRGTLLSDIVGRFPHGKHVQDQQASCAVCHDAHGSRQNPHLINFMLRDSTGRVVVAANRSGQLQYQTTLPGKGSCNLSCHGSDHNQRSY